MNLCGRSVRLAIRVIEIDEVFEVRIVSGFRCGSSSAKMAFFTASFSVAASIGQRIGKFARLRPRGLKRDFAAASGGQHQKPHDRITRHGHAVAGDPGLGVETFDRLDEFRRGTSVQAFFVENFQFADDGITVVCHDPAST